MTSRTVLELIGVTRDSLIDKGLEIIDRDGLARFSPERITLDLGVRPGALYKFFRSADEVHNALTARALARLVAVHENVDFNRGGRAALEAHALVERSFGVAYPALYATALRGSIGLSTEVAAQHQAYLGAMMRMLRGYEVPQRHTPELAACLSAALQGFVNAEIAGRGRSGAEGDRAYEQLLDMMDATARAVAAPELRRSA
jgi:AcrR family transcriptional regulator